MPGYEPFLLCDFHVHTQWSDGRLSIREVVDLYGKTGRFDVIAITDHILMERDLLARAGRLISLGLKQALGDPWAAMPHKFPLGSVIEGPVARITKFGAFVQLAEGIEGLVHISEISAEKRIGNSFSSRMDSRTRFVSGTSAVGMSQRPSNFIFSDKRCLKPSLNGSLSCSKTAVASAAIR